MFQPLDQKPVPLQAGEEAEYMLALKQEFRGAMKTLPFYIRPAAPKKGQFRVEDELFTGIYKVTMIFLFFYRMLWCLL